MYQPSRNSVREYTDTVMEFGGLNRKARGNEYEFHDMMNMSSREYPLLSPRKRRATAYSTEKKITSLYNKEALLWTENDGNYHRFYVNASEITSFRSTDVESKRQIVGMGAYALLFPDNKYINLLDHTDKGELGNKVEYSLGQGNGIRIIPCTMDGADIKGEMSVTAPLEPKNGAVWIDTSGEKSAYKKWDDSTKQWVQMSTTYFRIGRSGIGNGFSKWDCVKISGIETAYEDAGGTKEVDERVKNQLKTINAEGAIVYNIAADKKSLVFAGIIDTACYILSGTVTIERRIPDMDFVVESGNRLWGCKYGVVDGKVVNEIYACRQGDFKNWYAYLGISTDSYAVTVGSEGAFTGAAVFNKCPVFFKENCIHMIYGSTPSSYQTVTISCEGVEKGQGDSVCVADNVLYYKGPTGFLGFSGSLPQKISRNLGNINCEKIIGAGVGDKVYFACGDKDGGKIIYVYDTYYGIWHKEDTRNVQAFSRDGHILYALIHEDGKSRIESVTDETDLAMHIDDSNFPQLEDAVRWSAESVDIGYSDPNMKYIRKMTVRAKMSENSEFSVYVSCDGGPFKKVGNAVYGGGVHTNTLTFTPERCEFFRYRIEGKGDVQIVSVKKTMIQGSDKP